MADGTIDETRRSYDLVSEEYADRIFEELKDKPLDRELLDRFAAEVQILGPACDLGCGPGQVARYLHERGVPVVGIDLSTAMIEVARQRNPGIEFTQGDMLSLDLEDEALGGIAAFYAIIHIPRSKVVAALAEIKRVLRPGGLLLLAFHIGTETLHLDEWWGHQVSLDFRFFTPEEMKGFLGQAGLLVVDLIEREPYPGVEHPSRRAYLFARKP